jgi:hypothetical protein
MRVRVNVLVVFAIASGAWIARAGGFEDAPGEHRWVPSLAVTGGVTVQRQQGDQSSLLFKGDGANPQPPTTLRPGKTADDQAASPFVGGALELMTPALPSFPRLRLFATGEVLPTFATKRQLVHDGEPSRIHGPDLGAVLAVEEDNKHFTSGALGTQGGPRPTSLVYGSDEANGAGMRTVAKVENLVFGAKAGFAYAFEWRGRLMRIKPSLGWIHYKISARGYLVDAICGPGTTTNGTACTNTYNQAGQITNVGHLREVILKGHGSGEFDGVGPGVDLEMQTGRIGPVATAIFIGIGGYYVPGKREFHFTAAHTYNDFFGNDTATATWRTRVTPWIYRGGLGVRFQWVGSGE